ncbi:hypothetical protein MY11210_006146 [Beauveria gryllotalpidicola]
MSLSNMEQQKGTVEAATTPQRSAGKEKEQNPQLHNFVLVDRSIQQIGLGRYQWRMFLTCGFGFFLDSMLPASVGIVLPQIVKQCTTADKLDSTPLYGIYLPIYLQNNGAKLGDGSTFQTYRDYAISNTVAVLGPIFATAIIDFPVIGRRRGVAVTAACAAAFCGGFTSVRTMGANIAFSSMVSFWQTACYAMVFS